MPSYSINSVMNVRFIAAIKKQINRLKYSEIDMLKQHCINPFESAVAYPEKAMEIVYLIQIGNDIRYIGMSRNIQQRIAQHKQVWLSIERTHYRNAYPNNCNVKLYFYYVKEGENIAEIEQVMIAKYNPARNNKSSAYHIPIGQNKSDTSKRLAAKISKKREQELKDLANTELLKVIQIPIPDNPDNRNIFRQFWQCIFQFYMYCEYSKTPYIVIDRYTNSAKKGVYFQFSYKQFIEVFDIKQNACDWFVSQLIFLNYIEPPVEYTSIFPETNYYKFTKYFIELCKTATE